MGAATIVYRHLSDGVTVASMRWGSAAGWRSGARVRLSVASVLEPLVDL